MLYNIGFDKSLGLRETSIIKKIQTVLSDKRGWRRMGYKFDYIDVNSDLEVNFSILFVSDSYIKNKCNFSGLSCADISKNIIYINVDRWRRGSKLSGLKLDDYRTYVINHEVGHILGRGHNKPGRRGTRVPVMVQQTLGIGECKPNPWPLIWE